MRTKARSDTSQAQILQDLKTLGISYTDLHQVGKGCPDLIVGIEGFNFFFEIKNSVNGRLTPSEVEWTDAWKGQVHLTWSTGDILGYITTQFFRMSLPASAGRVIGLLNTLKAIKQ